LGQRFAAAVDATVARAVQFPNAGSPAPLGTRRMLVKDFPFSVYYRLDSAGIVVFAIAHHARRPGYWAGRE
jgi:plasmid stabilization system protein ParE